MAQEENPSLYAKFFNKDFLADCVLEKTGSEPGSYKAHRVILAANSGYFYKYFQDHQASGNISKITLPKFIKPTSNFEPHDVAGKVLEFFYTNQTAHDLTELGLNKKNAFSFLNHFVGLEQNKGKALTQDFIKNELVDQTNCADCLINAIKADNKEIKAKCIELLVPKFNDLLNDPKKRPSLLNMPLEMFKGILASDDLTIQNENALLNLVIEYIQSKESLPPKEPPKAEEAKHEEKPAGKPAEKPAEQPAEKSAEKPAEGKPVEKKSEEKPAEKPAEGKPAEKKSEEKPAEKPAEDAAKKPEEEKKKSAEEKPAEKKPAEEPAQKPVENPPPPQIPVKDFEIEAEAKLKLYKLSQDEKRELIKLLRLTHVSHDALIKASTLELFAEFKDLFIESLSAKLHNYESSENKGYTLNLKPRHYTEPLSPTKPVESPASTQNPTKDSTAGSPSKHPISSPQGSPTKPAPQQMVKSPPVREVSPQSYVRQPEKFSSPVSQSRSGPIYQSSPNKGQQGRYQPEYQDIQFGQTSESRFYQGGPQMGSQSYYSGQDYEQQQYYGSPNRRSQDPETLYKNKFAQSDTRFQAPKNTGSPSSMGYSQGTGVRGSGTLHSPSKPSKMMNPMVFSYKYDFDDNGAFYYLGSFGKQFSWKNPHEAGQVQAFFSSLGKGAVADFVGRECVNCRTLNEPNSFMGVDLGIGRYLIPTCYTIRNRDSDHHVLLNWVLEGSLDLKEWFWIDKRVHFTDDQEYNQSVAAIREDLKMKGYSSTWGIDEHQIEKIKANFEKNNRKFIGFRYFKITQMNKNSSGSYNLGLSGFELYGVGLGDNWLF